MGLKILWIGDSPTVSTGFGTVSNNILSRLHKKGYEITVLGVNHYGTPYNQEEFPFAIYPCEKGGPDQVYGVHRAWELADAVNPDIIFILNDPWIINSYIKVRPPELILPTSKIIGYYPTDAAPIKRMWLEVLNKLDAQVCYSHYAERVVQESNKNVRPPNLFQVYHGVDTKTYRPINQSIARARLGIDPKFFIVGMVARNQYRKRFDLLMKGFADFAKGKPEAKLYLHTALKDVGFDIIDTANQFEIESRLILTEDVTPSQGVSEERLNLIYNSFDVNALISLGDGFGLPVAESMATGCVQLVSDHSCLKELVEGHGGLTVKNNSWLLNTNGINTWGGVSDVADITKKLNILYNDKPYRVKLAEAGYAFITQPQFNWDFAVSKFEAIFKYLFHII